MISQRGDNENLNRMTDSIKTIYKNSGFEQIMFFLIYVENYLN